MTDDSELSATSCRTPAVRGRGWRAARPEAAWSCASSNANTWSRIDWLPFECWQEIVVVGDEQRVVHPCQSATSSSNAMPSSLAGISAFVRPRPPSEGSLVSSLTTSKKGVLTAAAARWYLALEMTHVVAPEDREEEVLELGFRTVPEPLAVPFVDGETSLVTATMSLTVYFLSVSSIHAYSCGSAPDSTSIVTILENLALYVPRPARGALCMMPTSVEPSGVMASPSIPLFAMRPTELVATSTISRSPCARKLTANISEA